LCDEAFIVPLELPTKIKKSKSYKKSQKEKRSTVDKTITDIEVV
jgi:hypothetical protein